MQVLLTARDATDALELAFLESRVQITGSVTRFDPTTPLQTARARAVGESWADLVGHTLARGVAIKLAVADYDGVLYPAAHRASAKAVRLLKQAAGLVPGAKLEVCALLHDGVSGFLSQLGRGPLNRLQLARTAGWLNRQAAADRTNALDDMPGLRPWLTTGRNGQLRALARSLPPVRRHIHNQKLVVFDHDKVFIGSFDLDPGQPDQPQAHGLSLMLTGPVVAECAAHLDSFRASAARPNAPPPPASRLLLRTLSCRRMTKSAIQGTTPVLQDIGRFHETLIRLTTRLVYIETARFQDPHLTARLAQLARDNPQLTMILILHERRSSSGGRIRLSGWTQGRALRQLAKAFGKRLFVGAYAQTGPDQPDPKAPPGSSPYSGTANVSIFDNRAGIVSSASLDRAGLRFNTEAGVYLNSPSDVAELRREVMARWLPTDAPEPYFALDTAAARWADLARSNQNCPISARRGLILPYSI